MELDFDKYCVVDGSPTTVLPAPRRRSKVTYRKSNGKLKCANGMLSLNEDHSEIRFNRYRSASCRDVRSRKADQEYNELLKRGSVYQCSKEVTRLRRTDDVGRKKIEFSRGSTSTFSFGIIDFLCRSDEDNSLAACNRSSIMCLSEQSTSSFCQNQEDLHSRGSVNYSFCTGPQRICPQSICSSIKRQKQSANNQSVQDLMITSDSGVAQINDGNSSQERDPSDKLLKSLSEKLALPHSSAQLESDGSKTSSPKSRFHPVRKMLDPFVKPKSQRSPLYCAKETGSESINEFVDLSPNRTICKSLLNDLSDKPHHVGDNSRCEMKDNFNSVPLSSPAYLHGLLKMEKKHGLPFFEFSVKSPEDVYVAKTCKVDKALTWVYTFHSRHHRKKSNASGWGFKENSKESSMVGQMLVSCYQCTEFKDAGALSDSLVTEFVLYDVSHSRRSISSQDSSCCSPDAGKAPVVSDVTLSESNCDENKISAKTKNKCQSKHSRDSGLFESSSSQPLAAAELHPGLEIAAIIMQVPFEKPESLKFKNEGRKIEKSLHSLLDLCRLEEEKEVISDSSNPGKMHVVIPAGHHSLPTAESRGPSPLLDRWRLGGGCDCGGWDMACPLNICGNSNFQIAEGRPPIVSEQAEIYVQGRKDNIPAFQMRAIEDGKYAVDFHAQFSSLQAFSISVAILHTAEATTAAEQGRSKQMLQSDYLVEEEIKYLLDATAEEGKIKTNKREEVLPSFVLNPPFSPIARV